MRHTRPAVAFALLLAVVPLAPAWGVQTQSGARSGRVIIRGSPDSVARDSTFARFFVNPQQIELMVRELMTSKALEETIARAMRDASETDRNRLFRQLNEISRRNQGLASAIQMQCSRAPNAEPAGYLGVQFEETMISRQNNEPAVYEIARPTIASVTAGSPAEKAGIRAGDLILSIGGQDARRLHLESLLKPGARLTVKLKRDNETKDFDVLVKERPSDYGNTMTCTRADDLVGDAPPMVFMSPRTGGTMSRQPLPKIVEVEGLPRMPSSSTSNFTFSSPSGGPGWAGATLTDVNDDWRVVLGVEGGVVVTRVASGTPAFDNGLRSGDVITSVNDTPVTSYARFLRLMNNSETRTFKLTITRLKKQQTLTLRLQ